MRHTGRHEGRHKGKLATVLVATALTVVAVGGSPAAAAPGGAAGLRVTGFLGEQRIAPGTTFQGTTVGGFSGIERDPASGRWFLISDDRSDLQPTRFYTADLRFEGPGGALSTVTPTSVTTLRRADGTPYPPLSAGDGTTVDPEDLRVHPGTGQIVWSQEGERIVPAGGQPTLIDPDVRVSRQDGTLVRVLPTPAPERVTAGDQGIRQNQGPEGLALAAHGALVVTALEGPLLQDGPVPTRTEGARTRIVVQSFTTGAVLAEYAYPLEPLFADSVPATGFASTGVTAILPVDDANRHRFLVLERSFVTGVGNKVRLYEVSTAGATDLGRGRGVPIGEARTVTKRLVADVADLPVASVDNIEGMAWGPMRPDGSRTLVLVSDDNFSASQVTQFVAVAVR